MKRTLTAWLRKGFALLLAVLCTVVTAYGESGVPIPYNEEGLMVDSEKVFQNAVFDANRIAGAPTKDQVLSQIKYQFENQRIYITHCSQLYPEKVEQVKGYFQMAKAYFLALPEDYYSEEKHLYTRRNEALHSMILTELAVTGDRAAYTEAMTQWGEKRLLNKADSYFQELILDYLRILLEQNNQTRLKQALAFLSEEELSPEVTRWYDQNLDKLTWLTMEELAAKGGIGLALDSLQGAFEGGKSVRIDPEGDLLISFDSVLSFSGIRPLEENTKTHGVFRSACESYELTVGESYVLKNGEKYPLSAPIQEGFYLPLDVFDSCFPRKVSLVRAPDTLGRRSYYYCLLEDDPKPYTRRQLTFPLAMAAPLHLHNMGTSSWGTVSYDRESLDEQITQLLPVVSNYRNSNKGSQWLGIQKHTLPDTWGITNRESLLMAIKQLLAKEDAQPEFAWDLSRAAQLMQWGYLASYLTLEETVEMQMDVARRTQKAYDSWEAFYVEYLTGYMMFSGGTTVGADGVDDRVYITAYLLNSPFIQELDWGMSLEIPPPEPEPEPVPPVESPESGAASQPPAEPAEKPAKPLFTGWMWAGLALLGAIGVACLRFGLAPLEKSKPTQKPEEKEPPR